MSARNRERKKQQWKLYVYRIVIISLIIIMMVLSILQI